MARDEMLSMTKVPPEDAGQASRKRPLPAFDVVITNSTSAVTRSPSPYAEAMLSEPDLDERVRMDESIDAGAECTLELSHKMETSLLNPLQEDVTHDLDHALSQFDGFFADNLPDRTSDEMLWTQLEIPTATEVGAPEAEPTERTHRRDVSDPSALSDTTLCTASCPSSPHDGEVERLAEAKPAKPARAPAKAPTKVSARAAARAARAAKAAAGANKVSDKSSDDEADSDECAGSNRRAASIARSDDVAAPSPGACPAPSARSRSYWSEAEDKTIIDCVNSMGQRWRVIAAKLPGRSDDAVRNRWLRLGSSEPPPPRVRRPPSERQRHVWSEEEDRIIADAVARMGNKWSHIKDLLGCQRTEHAIRNRWHRLQSAAADEAAHASQSEYAEQAEEPADDGGLFQVC